MLALRPLLFVLALASPLVAQQVPHEKYTLDNGLTVILHEDHRLPLVAINTWVYAGARDEAAGRSGFAHLFEHLMFMGTERVPEGQFDQIMEAAGGANNASTDFDRTNYFSWGPPAILPTLLWLDADRLEDLGRMMTQDKLDLQRAVVRNERRETTENTPYGRAQVKRTELLFPEWHPYHHDVIGSHADLEAATLDDVKEFFANFYAPNNASLVVAGDFDAAAIKPLIAELFGSLPRGVAPARRAAARPRLAGDLRCTLLDKVQLPMISMSCVAPDAYQPGDAETQAIAEILAAENSGRIYLRLVLDEPLAVDVSAEVEPLCLGSVFSLDILAMPDADLDRIERIVDEELARFFDEGASEEEVQRARAAIEREHLTHMEDLLWKADTLNEYQFHLGEPDSFQADLERFRALTPETLRPWRVLAPGERVILRVLPESPARPPSARDQRPDDLPQADLAPPAPEEFALENGIQVALFARHDLPLVEVALLFEAGADRVADPPSQEGATELLASLLSEGAGERDAPAFAAALQSLGAEFEASATRGGIGVTLSTLRRSCAPALALLADAVLRPRLAEEDWLRVKSLHLEELKQQEDIPEAVAARVARRVLFGAEHACGRPLDGTAASVAAIELADVAALRRALLHPARARLIVAGDLTAADARALLDEAFGSWTAPDEPAGSPALHDMPQGDALRVYLVDRPRAVQTVIHFALPGIARGDARRLPYELIGTVLGGTFTSRLNSNLREDKGFTYGAASAYAMEKRCGLFGAFSSVHAEATGAALTEFLGEFARLRTGDVTAEETEKARGAWRAEAVDTCASLSALVEEAAALFQADLPFSTFAADLAALPGVTAEQMNALARGAIPLEQGVLVLVGDAALVREQAAAAGLPEPILVDADGEIVR